jgi:hypothetical protein
MKREELVGKQVHGFRFESGKYNGLTYEAYRMNECVGNVGYISKYNPEKDWYTINFKNGWNYDYPAELIERFLFDKSLFDAEVPIQKTETTTTLSTDLNGYYLTPHLRYAPKMVPIPFADEFSTQELRLQQMWQGTDGSVKWIWVEEITFEQLEKEK